MDGNRNARAGYPGAIDINTPAKYNASPADTLLRFLNAVRTTGPGRWVSRCPAHYDRNPSLSVRETGDGTLLVRCWAGCTSSDVMMACGLTLADLFPRRIQGRSPLRRGERWIPGDVLRCLAAECTVVLMAVDAITRGERLTREDVDRVALAASRFRAAAGEVGHG